MILSIFYLVQPFNYLSRIIEKSATFAANILSDRQLTTGLHFAKGLQNELGYNQMESIDHTDGMKGKANVIYTGGFCCLHG